MDRNRARFAGLVAVALGTVATRAAVAQNKPFPHNAAYLNGFLPGNISASDALSSYANWKAKYLKADCGGSGSYRVEFNSPTGSTVSEGMGYGMVLTAYFGDKAEFDGLWKFVEKNVDTAGLMGWKILCNSSGTPSFDQSAGGAGSATDGDTDIGFALVAAVDQWGDAYRQTALDYLATLKKVDYTTCSQTGRNMAAAGNWDTGGCSASNSSYWMPGYLRVFHEFTGDSFWGKAADDAIALYLLNRDATTGLIANEVAQDGSTPSGQAIVDYNGCRVPWRAVADYLWYGTPDAKNVTDKMTDWVSTIGIANLVDGYKTDGTKTGQYTQQNPWVGGWTCGAMSKSQDAVNNFATDFKAIANDEGGYYGASLRSLYLLMLSGNFWKPGGPAAGGSGMDGGGATTTMMDGGAAGGTMDGGAVGTTNGGAAMAVADGGTGGGADAGATGGRASPAGSATSRCGCGAGQPGDIAGPALVAVLVLGARRRQARDAARR
jgi:endo-1,4-beta-D-glucanase Y